ncbi:MAG: FAD-binding oxidoreductase [Chloroflexi bacterium]|nr:FAD-binding oxidoreductase [Chloroflexota bacterium]
MTPNHNGSEVIIIGAGLIGTSIAYHLAKAGCKDVIVFDKAGIGSATSSKAGGGVRHQFNAEVNIRLSMEGIRLIKNFEAEFDRPSDYHQYGYMAVTTKEEDLKRFATRSALIQSLGVPSRMLSPREVKEMVPQLHTEDILGAIYGPNDGVADPHSILQGYASSAKRNGVRFLEDTEVTGMIRMRGRVNGVTTTKGDFTARFVINAAGAHARHVGRMVDYELPLELHRAHRFFAGPTEALRKDGPMIVDGTAGIVLRQESLCIVFGGTNPRVTESYDTPVGWDVFSHYAEAALHRLPLLENMGIMRGDTCINAYTPDDSALLGPVPGVEGFLVAGGLSGHGMMHSPAVGRMMASYITGQADPMLATFAVDRFERGAAIPEVRQIRPGWR